MSPAPRRPVVRVPISVFVLKLGICLGLLLSAAKPTLAAPAPEKDWITVPGSFLDSRLVRRPEVPAKPYRIIIDAPADPSARPHVTQSSGDEVVDGIAWDYVKTVLRSTRSHLEAGRGKELRFQLRLTPVAITVGKLQIPPNLLMPPAQGYFTPKPPYAREALLRRNSGHCLLRLKFAAAGGRPLEVALMETTENKTLDAVTVQWAVYRWLSAPMAQEHTTSVPVTYVMR